MKGVRRVAQHSCEEAYAESYRILTIGRGELLRILVAGFDEYSRNSWNGRQVLKKTKLNTTWLLYLLLVPMDPH